MRWQVYSFFVTTQLAVLWIAWALRVRRSHHGSSGLSLLHLNQKECLSIYPGVRWRHYANFPSYRHWIKNIYTFYMFEADSFIPCYIFRFRSRSPSPANAKRRRSRDSDSQISLQKQTITNTDASLRYHQKTTGIGKTETATATSTTSSGENLLFISFTFVKAVPVSCKL